MVINCSIGFDLDMMRYAIDRYRYKNNQDPYLFMSSKTCDLLDEACNREISAICVPVKSSYSLKELGEHGLVAKFQGINIYPNEDLPVGSVDIR